MHFPTSETARSLSDALSRWEKSLEPIRAQLEELSRRVADQYPQLIHSSEELGTRGWTVPEWATPGMIIDLVHKSTAELDQFFVAQYGGVRSRKSARLLRDVAAASILAPWHGILLQVSAAFRRGHHLVVVPALLPVLEGAVAAAAGQLAAGANPRAHANRLMTQSGGVDHLVLCSLHSFIVSVFARWSFSASAPTGINRHWILHGRLGDRTHADSLRLLHALASLAFVTEKQAAA